jgi:hypothetical protein
MNENHADGIPHQKIASERLIQNLSAGKLLRIISLIQIFIHLAAYIAAFIKLIIIEAGGYYDVGVIVFIGMTLISMPLFARGLWTINNCLKMSARQRTRVYYFHTLVMLWSAAMVKIGYSVI